MQTRCNGILPAGGLSLCLSVARLPALEGHRIGQNVLHVGGARVGQDGHAVDLGVVEDPGALPVERVEAAEVDEFPLHAELEAVLELPDQELHVAPAHLVAEGGDHAGEGGGRLLQALQHPLGRRVPLGHAGERHLVDQVVQGERSVEPLVDRQLLRLLLSLDVDKVLQDELKKGPIYNLI